MGARVLLADDNKINQQVSTALLVGHGLEVTVVGNGLEAVEAVKKNRFDIALMDIQMPEMDGFQATQLIRKLPGGTNLPIIALTAHAMVGDREKSLSAGMNDHITKPIDPDKLFKTLVHWITPGNRRAEAPVGKQQLVEEKEASTEEIPGIDLAIGLRQVAGNRELLNRLLREFYRDYQQVVRTIRGELQQGKRQEVLRLVHTIKGIAGSLGAHALHRITRDLETSLKGGEGVEYASLLEQFSNEIGRVFHGIESMQQDLPAEENASADDSGLEEGAALPDGGEVDQGVLQPLLEELQQLLSAGHSRSADKLEEIKPHCRTASLQAHCRRLAQSIEEFEFEEALLVLDTLAQGCGIILRKEK